MDVLYIVLRSNNWSAQPAKPVKRAAGTALISVRPVRVANSLSRELEKRTMHEFRNPSRKIPG